MPVRPLPWGKVAASSPSSGGVGPEPAMTKVAVFGNAGGGKSTLAKRLAELTQLPLHPLDLIQYKPGGGEVPHEQYLQAHAELLRRDAWIIDGFGCLASAWERFAAADTLIYVDLPLAIHHWWVTKRLVKGLFVNPEGWPADSPIWASTMNSYKVLWRCHRGLTPRYRRLVAEAAASKRVHHLRSPREIGVFLDAVRREQGCLGH
jgi:adenylate kinase family enzyme